MGSHSVTCHPAEVTFPPLPQPKLVLDGVLVVEIFDDAVPGRMTDDDAPRCGTLQLQQLHRSLPR